MPSHPEKNNIVGNLEQNLQVSVGYLKLLVNLALGCSTLLHQHGTNLAEFLPADTLRLLQSRFYSLTSISTKRADQEHSGLCLCCSVPHCYMQEELVFLSKAFCCYFSLSYRKDFLLL